MIDVITYWIIGGWGFLVFIVLLALLLNNPRVVIFILSGMALVILTLCLI